MHTNKLIKDDRGALDHAKRPQLHVCLNSFVSELTTNETFDVKDGVLGVHGGLLLGALTDANFTIGEGDTTKSK
jgi:hypothetical protein